MDGLAVPPEVKAKVDAQQAAEHAAANPKQEAKVETGEKPPAKEAVQTKPADKKKVELPPAEKGKNPWDALPKIEDKKPEAKQKETPAGEGDEVLPKGLDEKGGARWKELKAIEKQFKTQTEEIATLKKQIESGESGKVEMTMKEIEALRTEKAEIEQLVAERRLEKSEEFKKAVVEPVGIASRQIDQLVKMGGIDKRAMEEAVGVVDETERHIAVSKVLRQAEKAYADKRATLEAKVENGEASAADLDALGEPLDAVLVSQLNNAISKLHVAWGEEDRLRSQAREIQTAADVRDTSLKASAEKARQEEWSQASDALFDSLSEKFPFLKDEDTAKQIRERITQDSDPMTQALRAYAVPLLQVVTTERNQLSARVAELESVIADYNGSKPSTDGAQDRSTDSSDELRNMKPSEAARRNGA